MSQNALLEQVSKRAETLLFSTSFSPSSFILSVALSLSPSLSLSLSLDASVQSVSLPGQGASEWAAQLGNRFQADPSPFPYPDTVKPGKVNYVASVCVHWGWWGWVGCSGRQVLSLGMCGE